MRRLWARNRAFLLLLALGACSFGDRRVHLRLDRPDGEPALPRGISVILEQPEDARPEPQRLVGDVRSGVGVKTADIFSDDDVRDWVRTAMTRELQHAGFLVAQAGNPGRALRVSTTILVLSCEEGIGFGARMTLEFRIHGDDRTILNKTYESDNRHLLVDESSGRDAGDALRHCLTSILSSFVQDLVKIVETSPD